MSAVERHFEHGTLCCSIAPCHNMSLTPASLYRICDDWLLCHLHRPRLVCPSSWSWFQVFACRVWWILPRQIRKLYRCGSRPGSLPNPAWTSWKSWMNRERLVRAIVLLDPSRCEASRRSGCASFCPRVALGASGARSPLCPAARRGKILPRMTRGPRFWGVGASGGAKMLLGMHKCVIA